MLEKEDSQIELMLVPVKKEKELTEKLDAMLESKCLHGDSLIQVKLLDDMYPGAYGPGTSMRNSGTVDECRFEKQVHKTEGTKEIIETWLEDDRGHHFVHTGSSPLARGIQRATNIVKICIGIIPACAGNTHRVSLHQ